MTVPSFRGLTVPFLALIASVVACGGSTSKGSPSPSTDAGRDAPGVGNCDGEGILPPIVNVKNASDGSQICGATITAIGDGSEVEGPNLASGCSAHLAGCPTSAPGGGSLSCVDALSGVIGTETVAVSAPGFNTTTVTVTSGGQGCAGYTAASTVTVSLTPASIGIEAGCGAIEEIPPTVTVRDAKTGALICDPIITLVTDGASSPDAGSIGSPCASDFGGCPTSPPDGGSLSCVFAIFSDLGTFGSETIRVAAPGYEPAIVQNVQQGIGGCVSSPTPATQVDVSLQPAPADAGSDVVTPKDAASDVLMLDAGDAH